MRSSSARRRTVGFDLALRRRLGVADLVDEGVLGVAVVQGDAGGQAQVALAVPRAALVGDQAQGALERAVGQARDHRGALGVEALAAR